MKFKRRKRVGSKSRLIRQKKSTFNQKMRKIQQCEKIIEQKTCEICGERQQDQKIILCDQCDDAYHWSCLNLDKSPPHEIWLCPNCYQLRSRARQTVEMAPQVCYKCQKKVYGELKLSYLCQGESRELIIDASQLVECLYCRKHYHHDCFSRRKNSLNCWECQVKIRRQGPHNHEQHLRFLKSQVKMVEQIGYFQLTAGQKPHKLKRASLMNFKIFQQLTDWQLITRHEASLYYALKTRNLIFTEEQVYQSKQIMELNDSQKEIIKVHPLHAYDEKMYQMFKAKIKRGALVPVEIKEDRIVGFYLSALARIQKDTILFEYTGEVQSLRESLSEQKNDSVFTLLITGSSKQDLNIVSKLFGNMSRFVRGINNIEKDHRRKINIISVRFSHKNRMRVIFITKRTIQKGQILYLNYNAGTFQEYPTGNFV